jgi:hypothetical protein
MRPKRHCQVAKLKTPRPEFVVFERLSGQDLAMSQMRSIQTTLQALKAPSDIARLPSSKVTLPNYEKEQLGNVATKLESTGSGSFYNRAQSTKDQRWNNLIKDRPVSFFGWHALRYSEGRG